MQKKTLFDRFSNNLKMLSEQKLLFGVNLKYEKTYICPLCLVQFSEDDLDSTKPVHLTLEHVPPESLGGKHYLLTCNICNNGAGEEIDVHLHTQLTQVEKNEFLRDSKFEVHIEKNGSKMQGRIVVSDTKKISLTILEKNNDPKNIKEFNKSLTNDPNSRIITVKPRNKKAISFDRIPTALLKIAYLLAFEQFGYLFILDNTYEVIRKQILKPNYVLYAHKFWSEYDLPDVYLGTHIVNTFGLQSIMSLFTLETKRSKIKTMTFLPLPSPFNSIEIILSLFEKQFSLTPQISLELHKPHSDYLSNAKRNIQLNEKIRYVMNYHLGLKC